MRCASVVFVVALFTQASVHADEKRFEEFATFKEQQALDESVRAVEIKGRVGDVRVLCSDGPEVTIEAVVRVDPRRVDVSKAAKRFEDYVRVTKQGEVLVVADAREKSKKDEKESACSVSLKIGLPRVVAVTATTGVGNVHLATESGNTLLTAGVGNVSVEAESLESLTGKSGVGDVRLKVGTIARDLTAAAATGGVDISAGKLGGVVKIKTGTGNASLKITGEHAENEIAVEVGVGEIVLELPHDASCQFASRTGVGAISVEPRELIKTSRANVSGSASGGIGKGGPEVKLRTGVGGITLRVRENVTAKAQPAEVK